MPPERGQVSSLRVFGLPKAARVNRRVKFATPGATERQLEKVTSQIDRFLMRRRNKAREGEGVAKPVPEWGERLWIEWDETRGVCDKLDIDPAEPSAAVATTVPITATQHKTQIILPTEDTQETQGQDIDPDDMPEPEDVMAKPHTCRRGWRKIANRHYRKLDEEQIEEETDEEEEAQHLHEMRPMRSEHA